MTAPVKAALVRETARRGSNVNDVAAGVVAEQLGVPFVPAAGAAKC
jgi:hypothetical protein